MSSETQNDDPGEAALHLDERDRRLLDLLQADFPLVERPFGELARRLGVDETEALDRTRRLKGNGTIRQIGAIFDSAQLGYRSVLLAFRIEPSELESAAGRISAHPGVSHNYERDDVFNLWCALTVPPERDLYAEATRLADSAQAERWLFLPALEVFKIGVRFRMSEEGSNGEDLAAANASGISAPRSSVATPLSSGEREAVRLLQRDLVLVPEPFRTVCSGSGWSSESLLKKAKEFLEQGTMRRYAAILRHRHAGFTHNVMTVWSVPPGRSAGVGECLAGFRQVSHCYERAIVEGWPYSHYAMIHARSEEEIREVVSEMQSLCELTACRLLRTVREFKKVRVRYFEEDFGDVGG